MNERFVAYSEIVKIFRRLNLEKDLAEGDTLGFCSIDDILFITEDYKKGNLSFTNIIASFDILQKFQDNGKLFIMELTKDQLEFSLFEKNGDELDLWKTASTASISPKLSISLLSTKVTHMSCWSQTVFQEMLFNNSSEER